MNLLLHGAGHVVSVDCNPAQSALLELKATAIRCKHYCNNCMLKCRAVYAALFALM